MRKPWPANFIETEPQKREGDDKVTRCFVLKVDSIYFQTDNLEMRFEDVRPTLIKTAVDYIKKAPFWKEADFEKEILRRMQEDIDSNTH